MGLVSEIKKEALGNRTKIQSSEAADLEKIFNKMFYLEKNADKEVAFIKQMITRGLESQERVGLHASAIIKGEKDFCIRQQVLSLIYKQLQGEQIPVDLKRIFEEGNAIHEKWQRLFLRAGYSDVTDLDKTCFNNTYRVSFTPDIICFVPEFFNGKMIGEIKSVNTFQFQRQSKHPSASKQLQWYMFLSQEKAKKEHNWNGVDFTKGFVLNEDKNKQDFRLEVYNYNPEIVAPFIDRCEEIKYRYNKVMQEHKMVKRPENATGPNCKRCTKCAMKEACYNIGNGRVKL